MIRSRIHGVLTKGNVVGTQMHYRNVSDEVRDPYVLIDADGYELVDSEDYNLTVKR